jgi:hypothetical protein
VFLIGNKKNESFALVLDRIDIEWLNRIVIIWFLPKALLRNFQKIPKKT